MIQNGLLRSMPGATLERLRPHLEVVEAKRGLILSRLGSRVRYINFVNRGLISLVKTMQDGRTIEISAVGTEGASDPIALFGIDEAVMETVVQIPGSLLRVRVEAIRALLDTDTTLRALMQKYLRFSLHQISQTAACNRLHALEERCSRWLLIAHDSALSNSFPLTQEFLAMMLGVHRAGVTVAAHSLKHAGLIHYRHGIVTVTDRSGLEETACECYRTIEAELDTLFGTKAAPAHARWS